MEKSDTAEPKKYVRDGVLTTMPPMDRKARLDMERCAEFLARMIQKYGKEVMEDIGSTEA